MSPLELSDILALRLECTNPNCKQQSEPIPLDKADTVIVRTYMCPYCNSGPLPSRDVVWMEEVFTIARAIKAVREAQERDPQLTKFKLSFEVRVSAPTEKILGGCDARVA